MTDVLAMFPGQGSQQPSMSKTLLSNSPKARLIFEQAEDVSKMQLSKICSQPEEYDKLLLTAYQQPAILTHSFAVWSIIQEETGLVPSYFAGHSLGEYTALVAAEKLTFPRAIALVCLRAEAMQKAVPKGVGGMLAARTKDPELLSKLCFQIQNEREETLEIVNYNSAEQYILSGHMGSIDRAVSLLKENRILSRKLDVSAPFHSSLMKPARKAMIPHIEDTVFTHNDNCVIANTTGNPAQPYQAHHLIEQIDNPVLWSKSMEYALAQEVSCFIEFGPQKVLASLAKKITPKDARVHETSDPFSALKEIIQTIS